MWTNDLFHFLNFRRGHFHFATFFFDRAGGGHFFVLLANGVMEIFGDGVVIQIIRHLFSVGTGRFDGGLTFFSFVHRAFGAFGFAGDGFFFGRLVIAEGR